MGIRPFQTIPRNEREWATFLLGTQVTPSANSVGPTELQPEAVTPGNLSPTTVTQINTTADTAASTAVTAHEAASDPHPQYATDVALSAAASGAQSGAEASAAAALASHVADTDPHPVYTTASELTTALIPYLTQTAGDARYLQQTLTLTNAVDDAAAAGAGVSVGHLYRNGSVVMIRVT